MNVKTVSDLSVVLIGAGKVGQSLTQLMQSSGLTAQLVGRGQDAQIQAIAQADIILITTRDGSIQTVCDSLGPHLESGTVISHCSGALSSDVLNSAKQKGCHIASTHPLNTFPTIQASLQLFSAANNNDHNTYLYSEGDESALAVLLPLFAYLGFNTIKLESAAKTHYHTACVLACNYLTALMDTALESAEAANIDPMLFWQSVQPLIHTTIDNIGKHGSVDALSGPIARGDSDTVEHHLKALVERSTTAQNVYRALGLRALELAAQQGDLRGETRQKLDQILKFK